MSDGNGSPSGTMLRRALLLVASCGATAYFFPRYFSGMDLSPGSGDSVAPSSHAPAPSSDNIPTAEPPATESYQAQRGNQFYLTGSVNGNEIRFLVDTGATWVALTPEDATLLGYDLATLRWDVPARTANGMVTNAAVTLGDIRLGRIVEYNVPAIVMRQSGISLLGMSFLSRLRSWQISDNVLTIAS